MGIDTSGFLLYGERSVMVNTTDCGSVNASSILVVYPILFFEINGLIVQLDRTLGYEPRNQGSNPCETTICLRDLCKLAQLTVLETEFLWVRVPPKVQ